MDGIKIDESRFPVVLITYAGVPKPAENERMRRVIEGYWKAGKSYLTISDLTNSGNKDRQENRKIAEWTWDHRDQLKKYCRGAAIIVPNRTLRSIIRTYLYISKPVYPYEIVETRDEAERFIHECLRNRTIAA